MKRRIAFFTVLTILVTMASVVLADCGKIIIVRRAPIRVRVVKYRPPIIIVRPSDNTYFGGGLTLERTRTETESNARVETSSRTVTEGYRANANLASNGNVALPTVMENIGGVAGLGIFNEDDQRGVIGWNGKEEILVLSTNEKSTVGDTAMLSVMPLPGKPINITRADKELFNRAKKLVMSKMPGVGEMGVTFKTQIGSHSIFVWEIDDITTFEDMVNGFIAQEYGENFSVSLEKKTVEVIKDYFARGFKYFAFDLVMVKKDENTKEAIAYHFESNFVYYPMVISGVGGTGKTKVELVVFSKGGLTKNNGLNVINEDENKHPYTGYVYGRNKESGEGGTVEITNAELNGLDPAFGKLFDGGGAKGRIFIIEGELDKFDKDVVLSD